tara:strand:+ start:827 stop:976 length:150 start_codon:yes stop_codon:yes gene_type:complete
MRFPFNPFRRRNGSLPPLSASLRRDIGLSGIDVSDRLIGQLVATTRICM